MNRLIAFGLLTLGLIFAHGACQGPDTFDRSQQTGAAGGFGSGGNRAGSLGGHGAGGVTGAGGTTSTGGAPGMGGARGTGGATATGGATGTGGARGTGGATGAGGRVGAGGGPGTGGMTGAGGRSVTDGGAQGTGGADGGTANCVATIAANGYASGTVSPCSACRDNQTSLATMCSGMIDCIVPLWPCSGCRTDCLNHVGGSAPVAACVNALLADACGAP